MNETAAAAPCPAAVDWTVPAAWQAVDFISDLHLGPDTPRTFDAWQHHLEHTPADAVVMLGDWLEVWVGDDARRDGFGARCVEVLARVTKHRTVCFMAGNRDFLVGSDMLRDCGLVPLADPTRAIAFGQQLLLTHGDALCLGDTAYQKFRAMVRNPAWQQQLLALPLAERVRIGSEVRNQSERQKDGRSSPADWVDIDVPEAVRWLSASGTSTMVHGHTHRPRRETLAPGYVREVLTDWDLDHPPHRAEVLRWTAAGLARVAPAA